MKQSTSSIGHTSNRLRNVFRKTIQLILLALGVMALCITLILGTGFLLVLQEGSYQEPVPTPQFHLPQTTPSDYESMVTQFMGEVEPLITEMTKQNTAAKAIALEELENEFKDFSAGIPDLTTDLLSFRSRLGIGARNIGDWWDSARGNEQEMKRLERYALEKFELHVMSAQRLEEVLVESIATFQYALAQNRDQLMMQIETQLMRSQVPTALNWDKAAMLNFRNQLETAISERIAHHAKQSVSLFVLSETGAILGAGLVLKGAALIIGGTSIGSLMGPPGFVATLIISVTVGLIIDWWARESYAEQLNESIEDHLGKIHRAIITGDSETPGLEHALRQSVQATEQSVRAALRDELSD